MSLHTADSVDNWKYFDLISDQRKTSCCACAGFRSPQKENATESDFFQNTAERLYPGAAAWVNAGTMANTRIRVLAGNQRLAVVLP